MKRLAALTLLDLVPMITFAQMNIKQRVDLDDVQIRGEAQNQGISVLSRTKNSLDDRISIRSDFKNEINNELLAYFSTEKKEKK